MLVILILKKLTFSFQPIAYYFVDSPAKQDLVSKALHECIEGLSNIGLHVMGATMDQEPSHQKMVRELDEHIGDARLLFDAPHLLKCVRNCLLRHEIFVSVIVSVCLM